MAGDGVIRLLTETIGGYPSTHGGVFAISMKNGYYVSMDDDNPNYPRGTVFKMQNRRARAIVRPVGKSSGRGGGVIFNKSERTYGILKNAGFHNRDLKDGDK